MLQRVAYSGLCHLSQIQLRDYKTHSPDPGSAAEWQP